MAMFLKESSIYQELHTKNIKIWSVEVYIINGRVTGNNIDDRSHCGYFMVYADTTVVIIYWNTDQTFFYQ